MIPNTPSKPEPARRMTLSQVLEAVLSRGAREHSSVTLTRNSKGDTQIEVVVRTGDSEDVLTIDAVANKATDLYNTLRARYPLANGKVTP
jgi:hypothetical protein